MAEFTCQTRRKLTETWLGELYRKQFPNLVDVCVRKAWQEDCYYALDQMNSCQMTAGWFRRSLRSESLRDHGRRTAAGFPASFFRDRGQQPDPLFFRQAGGQHVNQYFRQKEHRPDQRQAAAPDGTKGALKNPLTED